MKKRLLPALALLLGTGIVLTSAVPAARAEESMEVLNKRVLTARAIYRELLSAPDGGVPENLLSRSRCVAVIPNVVKAAWILGGRYGKGVVSCRNARGVWSPPLMVKMLGGSIGFQIGASSTDLTLFFMTERGARSLLDSRVTLGADIGVAAGPVGRRAEAATDLGMEAEIYSYARSRGVFAGASLEGAHLAPDFEAISRYYGKYYSPDEILFDGKVDKVPASGREFSSILPAVSDF